MSRYEFALLRYVHDATSGEFANIGVIVFDPEAPRLLIRTSDRYRRLSEFFREINGPGVRAMIRHVERRFLKADEDLRWPDAFDSRPASLEELVRRVLPDEDAAIDISRVMYGVQDNLDARLDELFDEFVSRYEVVDERPGRDEDEVRRDFDKLLTHERLDTRVAFEYPIHGPHYRYSFHCGWRNGGPQVLEPISLDLSDQQGILEKATRWSGRLYNLARGPEFGFTAVVAPPSSSRLTAAFEEALAILRESQNVRAIFAEDEAEEALRLIEEDTANQGQPPV